MSDEQIDIDEAGKVVGAAAVLKEILLQDKQLKLSPVQAKAFKGLLADAQSKMEPLKFALLERIEATRAPAKAEPEPTGDSKRRPPERRRRGALDALTARVAR
jgi:hypothetical protein